MRLLFVLLLVVVCGCSGPSADAQVAGCTDPLADNYNSNATLNDGSCTYGPLAVLPEYSIVISDTLHETSGLIYWDNLLWTHNDNADLNLYAIDPENGALVQSCALPGITNIDWEDLAQDDTFIFIGDFGNNQSGNRQNLTIYRVSKATLCTNPFIETISFSYSDQTDFSATNPNSTNFDCEAFIVTHDSIFLFTKQWLNQQTRVYALPKTPGTHTAQLRGSFNVQGLVTGATSVEGKNLIALCGYSSMMQPFVYLLYDYEGTNFFSGNKRRINLDLPFTKTEAITTQNGVVYYLTNEETEVVNTPQGLHKVDLTPFLESYLSTIDLREHHNNIVIFPNPASITVSVRLNERYIGTAYTLYNVYGVRVESGFLNAGFSGIDCTGLSNGFYVLMLHGVGGKSFLIQR